MNEQKKNELTKITRNRIEIARKHLTGKSIQPFAKGYASLESELPQFEEKKMKFGEFAKTEYIALMTDIRKSKSIMDKAGGEEIMLQIYYAYSALVANIVDSYGGTATEFLGDGLLCLFPIEGNLGNDLTKALNSAKDILIARKDILLPVFRQLNLPDINFGIGLDYGPTIVTRFGFKGDSDLKAFGKCVYNVSRLCKGNNDIKVSLKYYTSVSKNLFKFNHVTDSQGGNAYSLIL
jgi:class 3 adenylate cyclase